MIAIPNMDKPKEAVNVEVIFRDSEGYVVGHKLDCPLIEIDDIKFKACLEILDKFMDELDHSLLYGKVRD